MTKEERSIPALLLAVVALGLIAVAFSSPWFHYESSTGRQTPPDGPQDPADTGEERHNIDFYAGHREGDVEPTDPALADKAQRAIETGLQVAAGALLLLVIGEIPRVALIVIRPVGIIAAAVALGGLGYALYAAWFWLPAALAGYGVEDPFTAKLLEPGYVRSNLLIGWAYAAVAVAFAFSAGVWKFSAGDARPEIIEQYGVDSD